VSYRLAAIPLYILFDVHFAEHNIVEVIQDLARIIMQMFFLCCENSTLLDGPNLVFLRFNDGTFR
jgi:hypothetical protein